MIDAAYWLYATTAALSLYGFCLFAWWYWRVEGKPSAVYVYIMFLLLGVFVDRGLTAHVRGHLLAGDLAMRDADLASWWWSARLWLVTICVAAIVIHMSYRAFVKRVYKK